MPSFEQVTLDDVRMLVAIEGQIGELKTYGRPLTPDAALEEIRKSTFYFIKDGDAFVGTAAYRIRADNSAYLSNIAILPSYRRQGIGRAAMLFLLAKCEGAARIDLVTHPENEGALRLYTSFGFKVETRKEDYFGDGEPRLVLVR